MEGTLKDWNVTALSMIRRALEGKDAANREGTSYGSSSRRRSLASATPSPDDSPPNVVSGANIGVDAPADARGQLSLQWVLSAVLRQSDSHGGQRVSERTEAREGGGSGGEEGSDGHAECLSPVRMDVGDEPAEVARVNLAELLRDAREEGDGKGEEEEEDEEGGVGVMEALVDTSEDLVAAVERQQEVSADGTGAGGVSGVALLDGIRDGTACRLGMLLLVGSSGLLRLAVLFASLC